MVTLFLFYSSAANNPHLKNPASVCSSTILILDGFSAVLTDTSRN